MIYIKNVALVSALGNSIDKTIHHLIQGVSPGMKQQRGWLPNDVSCLVGCVDGALPEITETLSKHNSRNNRLLLSAYQQIADEVDQLINSYGKHRIGVILGTSTSGLDESDHYVSEVLNQKEHREYAYEMQELGDPALFLSAYLGVSGPAYTISTACSSSSRAIISGYRLLQTDMADAVIVGGVDTLSRMSISGFNSLEALSPEQCIPFGASRQGINVGEAAALMILTKESAPIALMGYGESSDAWHMSAPHPEGDGAIQSIQQALNMSGLLPEDIGYINLHGTGTRLNDEMEAGVIHQIFGESTPCSSTKYLTGHTLGAAGACEAVLCWLLLSHRLSLPPQLYFGGERDSTLPECGLIEHEMQLNKPYMMSNSFAFGGNNTSLILGEIHE